MISRLAERQHGVVARWQLLEAGVSARQIGLRLESGRLREMYRGIYLAGAVPPPLANEQAALLLLGNKGVLSHRSAIALWNLIPPSPRDVWVTVPPGLSAARRGVRAYRTVLEPRDVRRREGLALTSPPRTFLDMAALLTPADLESLVAEAHYRRLAGEDELRDQLERNQGKRGTARLRAVLELDRGPQRTRSEAERWMLRLLRKARVTGFEMNARIHGFEVDVLWRDTGLAIEIDGYDAHSGRAAFERDRLKRATLTAHGIAVMPVTGRQIRDDPDGVLNRVMRALGAPKTALEWASDDCDLAC